MTDLTVDHLVGHAQGALSAPLAPEVIHECKRRVLDTLACALAGRRTDAAQIAVRIALRHSGDEMATLWGSRQRVSVDVAAFANGTMLRVLDMSDTYREKCGGHPSDVIAPIFCVAESTNATGLTLLGAVALAYDVYCGFCDAIDVNTMGFDQPLYGGAASVLAVSALLKLDSERMRHALALTIVPNLPLFQTRTGELSAWKGCAAANGARNAVFAAWLAREGCTGPEAPVEGRMGLWKVTGPFEWLAQRRDGRRAVSATHLKCFPICYHGQAAAWAAIDIHSRKLALDEVEAVEVATYGTAVALMGGDASRWSPRTRETADHSLPYVVAVALMRGGINDDDFGEDRLRDSGVAALMKKISVVEDADYTRSHPRTVPCRLTVRLRNGEALVSTVEYPKGHDKNPLDDRDLEEKFSTLAGGLLGTSRARQCMDAVWRIDQASSLQPLLDLIAVDS